jgi:hypothetical protein
MDKEEQEAFLDTLTKRGEAERVLAVADLIEKHERFFRCISLMLAGVTGAVASKPEDEHTVEQLAKHLTAACQSACVEAKEIQNLREALLSHISATVPQVILPETKTIN